MLFNIALIMTIGISIQAQAFTVTSRGATREGDMIRYNFTIDNWSVNDTTPGKCDSEGGLYNTCYVWTATWRYSTGGGTAAFPTEGLRQWWFLTRPGSTLGNMLQDMKQVGFNVPYRGSVLIHKSVDVTDACVGLSTARAGNSIGGAVNPFGPCLRLKDMKPPEITCTVPDVTIDMGEHLASRFAKYGDTSPEKLIPIKITNCSASLAYIVYTIKPTPSSPIINITNGIISLNSRSTAKGIALQILNEERQPLALNRNYTIRPGSFGRDYRFNMYARYIRTLPNGNSGSDIVTAGTANAEATIVMEYL